MRDAWGWTTENTESTEAEGPNAGFSHRRKRGSASIGAMRAKKIAIGLLTFLPGALFAKEPTADEAVVSEVATDFMMVAPEAVKGADAPRSTNVDRAVLLIHGLRGSALRKEDAYEAHFHDWQKPGSALVEALAKDSDVFAFTYGQNVPVDDIARLPELAEAVASIEAKGYRQIAVIGHSAGGVIARLFVEDNPRTGITKVIQVCSPNLGSKLGQMDKVARDPHEPFVRSLSDKTREKIQKKRADKKVPDSVDFVCVIGDGGGWGDFVVDDDSQWPPELRAQGIPAIQERTLHFTAMRSARTAERVAALVREPQARWEPTAIESARRQFLLNWFERWREDHDHKSDDAAASVIPPP